MINISEQGDSSPGSNPGYSLKKVGALTAAEKLLVVINVINRELEHATSVFSHEWKPEENTLYARNTETSVMNDPNDNNRTRCFLKSCFSKSNTLQALVLP